MNRGIAGSPFGFKHEDFEAKPTNAEIFVQSGNDSNPILPYRPAKGNSAKVFAQL
jgi:hypothetical protein